LNPHHDSSSTSAPIASPSAVRYRTLDHWRGLAALAVILHHTPIYTFETGAANLWGGALVALFHLGWWGVPAFFAISGYCVVAAADRTPDVKTYFKRRFRRIYPPYLITLCLILALWIPLGSIWSREPFSIPSPASLSFTAWIGNVTLTMLWLPRLARTSVPALLGPAWTLSYEEGYYLIVGLLRALFGRTWLMGGMVLVTAGVIAAPFLGIRVHSTPFDAYWYGFAAGAALHGCLSQPTRLGKGLVALALASAVLILTLQTPLDRLLALHSTPEAGGVIGGVFAIVLLVLHPCDTWLATHRLMTPMQWCGERCYSIYLMHWPVCKTLATLFHGLGWDEYAVLWPLATVPFSLLAGHLFHRVVERRFLNAKLDAPTQHT